MKYVKVALVCLLKVLVFLLSIDSEDKNTKQIDRFDNPDSDPYHDGSWEDVFGTVYSKGIDGKHYDASGSTWKG
ncbi:hypothetical protein [Pseudoalteromonas piscicida]|uniref:hypothetical protein n=1 Tax=Pseudoalteromonas piscicida TaxID=43662 RepID=UPI003094C1DF